jgi:hypothetical protein
MTRAAVANLNRQKSENMSYDTGTGNTNREASPNISGSPSRSRKAATTPQKGLPPQPSAKSTPTKELPDVPKFFIVRPAPSTANAKIERNDRRVFINRATMEKIGVHQGSMVLVQRLDVKTWSSASALDSDEEDSVYPSDEEGDLAGQMTVGTAWPMNRIEPNGTPSARRG